LLLRRTEVFPSEHHFKSDVSHHCDLHGTLKALESEAFSSHKLVDVQTRDICDSVKCKALDVKGFALDRQDADNMRG
jgi:hypothetical protein